MTREEEIKQAAEQYERDLFKMRGINRYDGHDIIQVAKDFAEWADEHPKNPWRDAVNDPPKDEQQVYVSWGDCNVKGIGVFCQDEKCWQVGWLESGVEVNYWMPIPQTPKGGEE